MRLTESMPRIWRLVGGGREDVEDRLDVEHDGDVGVPEQMVSRRAR